MDYTLLLSSDPIIQSWVGTRSANKEMRVEMKTSLLAGVRVQA
jgi:hypothetical protein